MWVNCGDTKTVSLLYSVSVITNEIDFYSFDMFPFAYICINLV